MVLNVVKPDGLAVSFVVMRSRGIFINSEDGLNLDTSLNEKFRAIRYCGGFVCY